MRDRCSMAYPLLTKKWPTTKKFFSGDSGKTILEDTSDKIYSDGEYADYSYFDGTNNEMLASYVDDIYQVSNFTR